MMAFEEHEADGTGEYSSTWGAADGTGEYSSTWGEADGLLEYSRAVIWGGSSLESRPRIAYPCMSRSRNKNRALVS